LDEACHLIVVGCGLVGMVTIRYGRRLTSTRKLSTVYSLI